MPRYRSKDRKCSIVPSLIEPFSSFFSINPSFFYSFVRSIIHFFILSFIHSLIDSLIQVTVNCVIPQKFHRIIMGPKGSKVQSITEEFGVQIKFPDRVDPEVMMIMIIRYGPEQPGIAM